MITINGNMQKAVEKFDKDTPVMNAYQDIGGGMG